MKPITQIIEQPEQVKSSRFVLLDRDGVINIDRSDYVKSLLECQLIPDAAAAIALLNKLGFRVLVISNQACIGRGIVSAARLRQINQHLAALVFDGGGIIEAFFVCPHAPEAGCQCRKPAPGLIDQAQQHYGFETVNTAFVGDSRRDVDAAFAAGCKPVLVESGKPLVAVSKAGIETHANLLDYAQSLGSQESMSNAL